MHELSIENAYYVVSDIPYTKAFVFTSPEHVQDGREHVQDGREYIHNSYTGEAVEQLMEALTNGYEFLLFVKEVDVASSCFHISVLFQRIRIDIINYSNYLGVTTYVLFYDGRFHQVRCPGSHKRLYIIRPFIEANIEQLESEYANDSNNRKLMYNICRGTKLSRDDPDNFDEIFKAMVSVSVKSARN